MFNFRSALLAWNGEEFTLADLQQHLSDLRLKHLGDIPPEIGVRELLLLGLERGWITEAPTGRMKIEVSEETAA